MLLEFCNVGKRYHYDEYSVIEQLSFCIEEGEIITILAQMQSGKSTIAKLIMGLEECSSGVIYYSGKVLAPSTDNGIAYFCDKPLLFENKTVEYNLRYPMAIRKIDKNVIKLKVEELSKQLGLDLKTKVKKLSHLQKVELSMARSQFRELKLVIIDSVESEDLLKYYKYACNKNSAVLILSTRVEQSFGKVYVLKDKKVAFCGDKQTAKEFIDKELWLQ
ncbi:MAG: ATP-binding cassette domain-containing protein [Clostridia bacterium]